MDNHKSFVSKVLFHKANMCCTMSSLQTRTNTLFKSGWFGRFCRRRAACYKAMLHSNKVGAWNWAARDMETTTLGSLLVRSVCQRKWFAAQEGKTPEAGPASKYLV